MGESEIWLVLKKHDEMIVLYDTEKSSHGGESKISRDFKEDTMK